MGTVVSIEAARLASQPCVRHGSACEGMDHHWMPDCLDDGEPIMVCKHCDAQREMTDEAFGWNRREPNSNGLSDVVDRQPAHIEELRQAIHEAHFLLCWTFQYFVSDDIGPQNNDWKVWHLDPGVRVHMNACQQSLYDALMALKQTDQ